MQEGCRISHLRLGGCRVRCFRVRSALVTSLPQGTAGRGRPRVDQPYVGSSSKRFVTSTQITTGSIPVSGPRWGRFQLLPINPHSIKGLSELLGTLHHTYAPPCDPSIRLISFRIARKIRFSPPTSFSPTFSRTKSCVEVNGFLWNPWLIMRKNICH